MNSSWSASRTTSASVCAVTSCWRKVAGRESESAPFHFGCAIDAQARGRQRLQAGLGDIVAAYGARCVFARRDPRERAFNLTQFFGDLDIERLEQLLIFELDSLFGEILRQWFGPVPRFARDAVVPLEQFVFAREQSAPDAV